MKKMSTNVALSTPHIKEALKTYGKKVALPKDDGRTTTIPLTDEYKDLLDFLQDNIPMTPAQRGQINRWLVGPIPANEIESSTVADFFKKIDFLNTATGPVLETKIAGRWYPIMATAQKYKTFMGDWIVSLYYHGQIGSIQYGRRATIGSWVFEDNSGKAVKKHINDILARYNLRVASLENIAKAKAASAKVLELETKAGKVFDATGVGLTHHDFWGWSDVNVGWKDAPATVIIEPTLENESTDDEYEMNTETWTLPFVRVFSLKHKAYVYVEVEDLQQHVFHTEGKNKIVLAPKMMTALNSIFNAKQDHIFGDLFHGRHGGIVVLANGPSGVGKTLTAEVFAESQERPLYSMEMGEIGTSLEKVEESLQKIFARAKKWNAVLLFDEADIFLSERVASDLERSAIVGIFLRLLDYYEGTFFLTTNRGEGIDKAFKSRVTLYLDYPELSPETRLKIWQNMIGASGINVIVDHVSWEQISKEGLNGRQIRNQVRLLKLMYPDNQVKTSELIESLEFAAR